MAQAKKCDRCGAFYENNTRYPVSIRSCKTAIDGITFSTRNDDTVGYMDLCDDCITELKAFLGCKED